LAEAAAKNPKAVNNRKNFFMWLTSFLDVVQSRAARRGVE